ncbi:saccharopine dehydrogenase family protein [Pelagicoccus sp. SDUM812002]|uniref:saccharopine dehydrogenase family protein n=1 Tax=Pelagicoccus sp. SDUM812002 TaxID=3041266 RepID=UPI00280DE063|nr:saccharopine dehydrogenase family protein [Pelagicoccus sp. SDUM812002]MDQ8184522.1 saccharopine dehydrogenase family protein [Pelagicoccus sp. SDUM812002]
MSKKVLIIGAGGVGSVVTHKCAMNRDVFGEICLASRRKSSCEKIAEQIDSEIHIAQVDADNTAETVALIKDFKPDLVLNVALPYQDLVIMDACLETGTDYLDTANYEPRDEAKFEYSWQWAYHERFKDAGIMALLGSGFDPGVTNIFTAYAEKHHFDTIDTLDIIDCNAGDHGKAFATNFNPEINIREVTANGRFFENGEWKETPPLSEKRVFDFPDGIGPKDMYLMYHEEMESLAKNFPEIKRMRFWMTFGQQYLTHLKVLENVGMTRIDPVIYNGQEIIPLQFLKAVLPDPGSLGESTKGRTCIGVVADGHKNGERKHYYLYNICDHEACFAEVNSQAISYTTGVPAMIGAKMMLTNQWRGKGVFNVEQFDPDPFMEQLNVQGLPWTEQWLDAKPEVLV